MCVVIGSTLDGEFHLQEPVSIHDSFPKLLPLTASVGDLIQIQLSHPVVPGPRPTSVRVFSDHGAVAL